MSPRVPGLGLSHLQMGHQGHAGNWISQWPVWVNVELLGDLCCPGSLSTDGSQPGLKEPRLLELLGAQCARSTAEQGAPSALR